MNPLAQLVTALLEAAEPVAQIHEEMNFAPDLWPLMGTVLAPVESLFAPRDLLTATAVLEAVTPLLLETSLLLVAPAAEAA